MGALGVVLRHPQALTPPNTLTNPNTQQPVDLQRLTAKQRLEISRQTVASELDRDRVITGGLGMELGLGL